MSEDAPQENQPIQEGVEHGPHEFSGTLGLSMDEEKLWQDRYAAQAAFEDGYIDKNAEDKLEDNAREALRNAGESEVAPRAEYESSETEQSRESVDSAEIELALAGLSDKLGSARNALRSARSHTRFVRNYSPTPPGPRPHPEAGGMDHQDWQVASLEYRDYDEEAEYENAVAAEERADQEYWDLLDIEDAIKAGNPDLVKFYADVERRRQQEELERLRQAEEGRKYEEMSEQGAEIAGAKELSVSINELVVVAQEGNLPDVLGNWKHWEGKARAMLYDGDHVFDKKASETDGAYIRLAIGKQMIKVKGGFQTNVPTDTPVDAIGRQITLITSSEESEVTAMLPAQFSKPEHGDFRRFILWGDGRVTSQQSASRGTRDKSSYPNARINEGDINTIRDSVNNILESSTVRS